MFLRSYLLNFKSMQHIVSVIVHIIFFVKYVINMHPTRKLSLLKGDL